MVRLKKNKGGAKSMKEDLGRVKIFIDGSNFYYSTLKKGLKVDFEKFVEKLSFGGKLIEALYYVAPLDIEKNKDKYWKHQRFLEILGEIENFKVVLCTLKKIKSSLGDFIYLIKGDDVKLSNDLLMGAVDDLYDSAIVVSGDEDFISPVRIVQEKYGKKVINAYFNRSSSINLRNQCDFSINLDELIKEVLRKKEEKESSALSENHAER
jgi:uncharacterized LabA/DUF88 family protein